MKLRSVLTAAAAVAVASLAAPPASAAETIRYAGDNRYETATQVSQIVFADGADVVYVATGESFADALAGGAAAAEEGGPILLVTKDEVPEATAVELDRLTVSEVRVLGGDAVISDEVLAEIEDITGGAEVTRVSGNNRYTTAVEVSQLVFEPGVPRVVITGGETFPDALAAGPAAAEGNGPVLLVQPNDIPDTVAAELGRLQPSGITIVGGTGVVSAAVEAELAQYTEGDVLRLAGGDRYATANAVSFGTFDAPRGTVFIASGLGFADALAGTPAAAVIVGGAPILLTPPNCIPSATQAEIDRLQPDTIVLLGGSGALGAGVEGGDACESVNG